MIMGLGDTSTPAATVAPSFTQGLTLWETPTSAVTAIGSIFQNASTAFSSSLLPFTAGVLLPPIALIAILMGMGKGRR
jgi:hypothetical protein